MVVTDDDDCTMIVLCIMSNRFYTRSDGGVDVGGCPAYTWRGGRGRKVTNHSDIIFFKYTRGPGADRRIFINARAGQCGSYNKSIKPTDDYIIIQRR